MTRARMLWTCTTPDCEEAGRGFTDEPGLWCSICLEDLTGIYDTTGTFITDEEARCA